MAERANVQDREGSLLLLGSFICVAILGYGVWVADKDLHIRMDQILEIFLLILIPLWVIYEVISYFPARRKKRAEMWPPVRPHISPNLDAKQLDKADEEDAVLLGHESNGDPVYWSNEKRAWQTIVSGMSGSGKTTLIETILQQDIKRGIPIIFFDGKGEKKFLDKIIPVVEAAGRMADFRLIDPSQPDKSCAFNPFWAPDGTSDEHVSFVFESFKIDGGDDFFDQHQKVYLTNIARILRFTGKRYNFYDILVAAYDAEQLAVLIKTAKENAKNWDFVSVQQRRNLEMSIQNLVETFADKERVSKIQGLINNLVTFLSDSLSAITGPYDNLLTIEDVLDKNLILYVNLNINVNQGAVTALGRLIIQNLQLALGQIYARTNWGTSHTFVSVLLDEFAPFVYDNFSPILQTARGANVGFLFALQTYGQLASVGFGLKDSLTAGPNNTFMLRMKDDNTTTQFRDESGLVTRERISMQVQKTGLLSGSEYEERDSGSKTETLETLISDQQLKALPTGDMQVLMSDHVKGLVHKHVHVRRPFEHYIKLPEDNLYPALTELMEDSGGLNLRFREKDMEAKAGNDRNNRGNKRPRGDRQ